jgi:PAS domain S-box-containing protein
MILGPGLACHRTDRTDGATHDGRRMVTAEGRVTGQPFTVQGAVVELFEALVDVIFCAKDTEHRYVAVNLAFVRRTGRRSRREVLGARAADVFAPAPAERYEEQDRRVFASGRPLRDELELVRRSDGTMGWYVTTKIPVAEDGVVTGLVSLSRDLQRPSEESVEVAALSSVVRLVRDHDESVRPLTVADLASSAGCSADQLQRRMRRVFGISPTQYLLRERVDRAAWLLAATDEPIATVAARCGFYDQAQLTRHFGRFIGLTPAQYRAEQRS